MRRVVVIFGLSGSGKSFLSSILAERFGYEWLRSDVIRKELAGLPPDRSAKAEFGRGIYTEEMTKKVYEEMVRRARKLLGEGKRVVLDATFLKRWQRELVRKEFPDALFLLAWAPEETIKERLERRKDVSDADFSVYLKQKEVFEEPSEVKYLKINTDRPKEDLIKELERVLS